MTSGFKQAAGAAAAGCLALILASCGPSVGRQDAQEFNHPAIRKARARLNEGDTAAAMAHLRKALDAQPALAQAHLEAAQLLDHYARDPLRAIYHYQRYLELRPETEKRDMIEGFIQKNKIAFAAAVYEQTPGLDKRVQALQEENERLRGTVRQLRANLAERRRAAAEPAAAPEIAPTGVLYVVRSGDTLSRIAAEFYQNPRLWKKIAAANRERLRDGDKVAVGQALVIPP